MTDPITYNVKFGGSTFAFQLHRRELQFGSAGRGDYFWMDQRPLRSKQGGPNFRPCIDLWGRAAEEAGEAQFEGNLRIRALAECYPLISTSRGMQEVFLDAHLFGNVSRGTQRERRRKAMRDLSLLEDEIMRLTQLAHSRDLKAIAAEIDCALTEDFPPVIDQSALDRRYEEWTAEGINALRRNSESGLGGFKSEIATRLKQCRKRGGLSSDERRFLNMFAYECKAAFYLCYSSAWIAITMQLSAKSEADDLGLRFMALWHYQNQRPPGDDRWIDVLHGHVLALHPLSAIMLNTPEHLETIGRWIGHPQHDEFIARKRLADSAEYWDLVAAILIAAHKYRRMREAWNTARGKTTFTLDESRDGERTYVDVDAALNEFASDEHYVCTACNGPLKFVAMGHQDLGEETVQAEYACDLCKHLNLITLEWNSVSDWLAGASSRSRKHSSV